jgi:hypothetical protein
MATASGLYYQRGATLYDTTVYYGGISYVENSLTWRAACPARGIPRAVVGQSESVTGDMSELQNYLFTQSRTVHPSNPTETRFPNEISAA